MSLPLQYFTLYIGNPTRKDLPSPTFIVFSGEYVPEVSDSVFISNLKSENFPHCLYILLVSVHIMQMLVVLLRVTLVGAILMVL